MQSGQDPMIGKRLERYQILQLLGGGGMGAVYKARDLALQRDVAVKILHTNFAAVPHFQERFLQEARTAARLDHPNIIKVFDFGLQSGLFYIIMEYVPGISLRQRQKDLLAAKKRMQIQEAIAITTQVAEALDYAHSMGVFHRDIKPDNILLKPRQASATNPAPIQAIITDLGLAKLAEGGMSTIAGLTLGTPAYMSPEQLQGKQVSERSDVYALGVLMYEILAGRPPFPVNTLSEALRRVIQEPAPPLRPRRGDLPEALEVIILRALAKEPEARFGSAGAFAQALVEVLAHMANLSIQLTPKTEGEPGERTIADRTSNDLALDLDATSKSVSLDFLEANFLDGESRRMPLSALFTIGREGGNDLVLVDGKVSRHHARIERRGDHYQIIDLGSSNGTFLAEARLLPHTPVAWNPSQAERIGSTELRLQLSQPPDTGRQVVPILEPQTAEEQSGGIPDPGSRAQPTQPIAFTANFEEVELPVPGIGYVVITNQASQTIVFQIRLRSKENLILFAPVEGVLRLNPGMQNSFSFTARPLHQSIVGKMQTVPYLARVSTAEGVEQTLHGIGHIKPRLPVWALALIISLGLVATASCLFLSGVLR